MYAKPRWLLKSEHPNHTYALINVFILHTLKQKELQESEK
jgi:hypothetical protein